MTPPPPTLPGAVLLPPTDSVPATGGSPGGGDEFGGMLRQQMGEHAAAPPREPAPPGAPPVAPPEPATGDGAPLAPGAGAVAESAGASPRAAGAVESPVEAVDGAAPAELALAGNVTVPAAVRPVQVQTPERTATRAPRADKESVSAPLPQLASPSRVDTAMETSGRPIAPPPAGPGLVSPEGEPAIPAGTESGVGTARPQAPPVQVSGNRAAAAGATPAVDRSAATPPPAVVSAPAVEPQGATPPVASVAAAPGNRTRTAATMPLQDPGAAVVVPEPRNGASHNHVLPDRGHAAATLANSASATPLRPPEAPARAAVAPDRIVTTASPGAFQDARVGGAPSPAPLPSGAAPAPDVATTPAGAVPPGAWRAGSANVVVTSSGAEVQDPAVAAGRAAEAGSPARPLPTAPSAEAVTLAGAVERRAAVATARRPSAGALDLPAAASETQGTTRSVSSASGLMAPPPPGAPGAAQMTSPVTVLDPVSEPVSDPRWGAAIGARLAVSVASGVHTASVALNPRDLGPLQLTLTMSDDEASVTFVSNHAAVREAIEAALPRLREMLSEQGINLTDVDVFSGGDRAGDRRGDREAALQARREAGDDDPATAEPAAPRRPALGDGLVDTFA